MEERMMYRTIRFAGFCLLALGLLDAPQPSAAQGALARVRFMHAAPDAPAVDVLVDDEAVVENLAFPTIGAYLSLPAGSHRISVQPAAQPAAAALLMTDVTFAADRAYTAIAVSEPTAALTVVEDDLTAPAAGTARIRVIHMSPDAPGVDIAALNGPTLFTDVAYTEHSAYQEIAAGSYNLRAVAASATTVIVQLPNTTLQAGTIYDLIPAGRLANIQVQIATYTPADVPSTDPATTMQPTLPGTGRSAPPGLTLGLGLLLILGGLWLRRRPLR
jgi:hypothetical protein